MCRRLCRIPTNYLFIQTMNFVKWQWYINSTICSYYRYIFFNVIIIWIICFWKGFLCECIFNVIFQDLCLFVFCLLNPSYFTEVYWHVNCIYMCIAYTLHIILYNLLGLFPAVFTLLFTKFIFSINTQGSEFESVHVETFYTFSICFVWIV